ncbi:hypothetical protein FRC10_011705, partial [Ceratobasidium sp. 414]
MLRPECRAQRMHNLQTTQRARRESEYKIAGPSNRPHPSLGQPGPLTRQTAPPSNGATSAKQRYNDPRRWTNNRRTCHQPYVERFPISSAGAPISDERAHLHNLKAYLESCGNLANPRNMEAAELLMTTGLSGKARTWHLQSSFYQNLGHDCKHCCCKGKGKAKGLWQNDRQMLKDIDQLPHGPDWHTQELITGEGTHERSHILYKRSVIDVVRELIGNPAFKRVMRYTPERHWTSGTRASRMYGEMWTGDWWWQRQLFLEDRRGTIAPLIIVSDKTNLTKLSGNKAVYPVYLTIGNISKSYRRQPTKHATMVISYLPVDEFKDVPSKALRTRLKGELIHAAMASVMEPLEKAGQEGVEMWCADGRLCRVYPLLAAFVGDWPEQCDMACVVRSRCPKCLKRRAGRGDECTALARTRLSTLMAIDWYLEMGRKAALDGLGLKPWWPWWANLPGTEFATAQGLVQGARHAVKYRLEDGWPSGDAEAEADEEGWEDEEDDNDKEEGERRQGAALDGDEVEYPAPEFAITVQPTRRVTLPELVDVYGATSFEWALRAFLRPHAHSRGRYSILPHELFDIWHKLTLCHHPLSFTPNEPSQCDVIHVWPPVYDERRCLCTRFEPVFDMALFMHDCDKFGHHRTYKFLRLFSCITRLTCSPLLRYLYNGELIYLERFALFDAQASPVHHLHTTSHAQTGNGCQSIVVPIEDVVLACHLAPQFRHIFADAHLDLHTDLLNDTRRFFFNHYYNNY